MFGKDAECSSLEATSLLFSAGAEHRPPGLCTVPLAEKLLGKVNCLSQSFSACRLAACAP